MAAFPKEGCDLGPLKHNCRFCGAFTWYEERTNKGKQRKISDFGFCCLKGKIRLPTIKERPEILKKLLNPKTNIYTKKIQENIRVYNSMFAMTAMGGKINHEINKTKGPCV